MERENSEQPLASKNNQRIVLYLTLLTGLLAFWGLGNNDLWDDEAFTAVYGRNLVETGQLIAWDGRNLMAYGMLGWMSEDMINTHSPPLQYTVAGLSLAIFGDSAAGGRTLFVLIGLISIPLFATWYRHEFDSDDFWIVALILVLSIPFLLYIRQLRYYSLGLTSFAGLLWVWAVIRHVKQYRWWFLLGTLFLCLLVLSQYLYAAGAVAVMGISLVRERYRNRKNFTFLAMVAVVGLVSAIWFFLRNAQVMGQVMNSGEIGQLDKFARLLFMVPRDMARFEFFPVGMLLFAAGGVWALGRAGTTHLRDIFLVLAYGAGVITAVSLVSLQKPPSINIDADMRYYIFLIPLSAVVAAKIYELLRETRFPGVAPLFLVVLISSNVLTLNFWELSIKLSKPITLSWASWRSSLKGPGAWQPRTWPWQSLLR